MPDHHHTMRLMRFWGHGYARLSQPGYDRGTEGGANNPKPDSQRRVMPHQENVHVQINDKSMIGKQVDNDDSCVRH